MSRTEVLKSLRDAFPVNNVIGTEDVVEDTGYLGSERAAVRDAFGGKRWSDVDTRAVFDNNTCLSSFTDKGFCAYVPAVLAAILDDPEGADVLFDFMIGALTPPSATREMEDSALGKSRDAGMLTDEVVVSIKDPQTRERLDNRFSRRMACLSSAQRAAIRDWLEFVDSEFRDRFYFRGKAMGITPRLAIDVYWGKDSTSG